LNTPGTDLYRKGEHLFGLHESRAALTAGATPALVEEPLNALGLTLAGAGHTVGVATLGTALTDGQADLLGPYIRVDGPGILVATDNDSPGQQAAERIYWQLTTRGDDPRRLALPVRLDPADLFHRDGATVLWTAIEASRGLADALLDARLTPRFCDRSTSDTHAALPDIGAIIVALPPSRGWHTSAGSPRPSACRPAPSTGPCSKPNQSPRRPAGPRLVPDRRPGQRPLMRIHRKGHTGPPSHDTQPGLHHSL
jgi:hypothetical protein